jgi:hypothetical protein
MAPYPFLSATAWLFIRFCFRVTSYGMADSLGGLPVLEEIAFLRDELRHGTSHFLHCRNSQWLPFNISSKVEFIMLIDAHYYLALKTWPNNKSNRYGYQTYRFAVITPWQVNSSMYRVNTLSTSPAAKTVAIVAAILL